MYSTADSAAPTVLFSLALSSLESHSQPLPFDPLSIQFVLVFVAQRAPFSSRSPSTHTVLVLKTYRAVSLDLQLIRVASMTSFQRPRNRPNRAAYRPITTSTLPAPPHRRCPPFFQRSSFSFSHRATAVCIPGIYNTTAVRPTASPLWPEPSLAAAVRSLPWAAYALPHSAPSPLAPPHDVIVCSLWKRHRPFCVPSRTCL